MAEEKVPRTENNEFSLEKVVSSAIQIPGVKVDRDKFLSDTFSSDTEVLVRVLEKGPVSAGISQEELNRLAKKLIISRTGTSSLVSFAAGIPGGFAMAATIPADVLQFFGMSLRLAQELSYLYGASDLWNGGQIDDERVRNQLILYCGVMFGATGAAAGVRVLSTQIAKTALKKIPQKALTKTFWYPLVKSIGKAIGVKVTKTTVASGISKAIPVVGGIISGGLNFATMMPMANRLHESLDKACFNYSDEELEKDLKEIDEVSEIEHEDQPSVLEKAGNAVKGAGSAVTGFFSNLSKKSEPKADTDIVKQMEKLMQLKEMGALSDDEFEEKRKKLLEKLE